MYQSLDQFNGDPRPSYPANNGMQYDWEVPNDMVVASPGGVSGVHHHWTKGFYGIGNSSSDFYAGQGYRYPTDAGPYGNLYQTGYGGIDQTGNYLPPPDTRWWSNQPLQQTSYASNELASFKPSSTKEGFTVMTDSTDSGIERLDDEKKALPDKIEGISIKANYSPWLLFILFIFAFVAFDLWAETGRLFINDHLRAGKKITWKSTLMYAVIVTVFFAAVIYFVGVPLTTFETI